METNTTNQSMPLPVPNATAVLVLGILSIVTCWCFGIIGLTLGIIALVLANKGSQVYLSNPSAYSEASFKNLKAGKICAIVGTSLSALYVVYFIVYVIIIGAAAGGIMSTLPWHAWK
jgi:hypothetical protein